MPRRLRLRPRRAPRWLALIGLVVAAAVGLGALPERAPARPGDVLPLTGFDLWDGRWNLVWLAKDYERALVVTMNEVGTIVGGRGNDFTLSGEESVDILAGEYELDGVRGTFQFRILRDHYRAFAGWLKPAGGAKQKVGGAYIDGGSTTARVTVALSADDRKPAAGDIVYLKASVEAEGPAAVPPGTHLWLFLPDGALDASLVSATNATCRVRPNADAVDCTLPALGPKRRRAGMSVSVRIADAAAGRTLGFTLELQQGTSEGAALAGHRRRVIRVNVRGARIPNLAGEWLGQDGGRYTISQTAGSRSVTWEAIAADGVTWAHSFTGQITTDGKYLLGRFRDHEPGLFRNEGDLALRIVSPNSLEWVAEHAGVVSFDTATRSWTRCPASGCGATFRITGVSYPATVVAGAPAATMTVHWAGSPVFPVTAVYAPDSCPTGVTCTTPRQTFASFANPLAFAGTVGCWGSFPNPVVFDYSVYLEDATGKRTALYDADFTCLPA